MTTLNEAKRLQWKYIFKVCCLKLHVLGVCSPITMWNPLVLYVPSYIPITVFLSFLNKQALASALPLLQSGQLWQSSHSMLSVITYGFCLLNWGSTVFPFCSYREHFLSCTDAFSYGYMDRPWRKKTLAHVIS